MPICKDGAYEIAEKIGLNWGLDPHWKAKWFKNMQDMIFLSFQDYDFDDVCLEVINFIRFSKSDKCPPFGAIEAAIVSALGSEKITQYKEQGAVGCGHCDNGRRGVVCRFYKRSDPEQQIMSWSCRCVCRLGDKYRKTMCTFEQMQDWLLGDRPDLVLLAQAQKNDPVFIKIHGIYISDHVTGTEVYADENRGPWLGHETLTEAQFFSEADNPKNRYKTGIKRRPSDAILQKRKRMFESALASIVKR